MNDPILNSFSAWLDAALDDVPSYVRAFNFNLYEGLASWDVQLTGTKSFDPTNETWAIDPVYSCPQMLLIAKTAVGTEWENALSTAIELVATYLGSGKKREILRTSEGVGVGFVDGDLTILWPA